MSEDEVVDGPAVAAAIISRMQAGAQDRIVNAIRSAEPSLAAKIEEKLYNFDDLLALTPQSLQMLIQSVDPRDLVISFKTASSEVKEYIRFNMSERKRAIIDEEFAALPPMRLTEVQAAQRRVLQKMEELKNQGSLRSRDENDVWVLLTGSADVLVRFF